MNSFPFCYESMEDFSNKIVYYESSRGCPFSCSYCLSSIDKSLRFRDIEKVKEELLFFINQKVPQVKFVDRTFNCNHEHAMAIWQFIKDNDNGITNFHFEISADILNDREIDMLSGMRPGLVQLEIGVQSVNELTIKEIHRTMKLEKVKDAVKRIKAGKNVHQHLDLIAGLPYEDYKSFRHSFDEIHKLWPEQLQLGFLKVLKGSYMFEHAFEYEIVYHDTPPYEVLSTKWLSFSDVLQIKKIEEMTEVYYNSGQFSLTMKAVATMLLGAGKSMFDFYKSLGDFYESRGYFNLSHSRIRRCEIFLEFIDNIKYEKELKKDICKLFSETLIFDLYDRENCKTRPSWAPDLSRYKDETKKLGVNGKLSHAEPFHFNFRELLETDIPSEKNELPKYSEALNWVLFDYASNSNKSIHNFKKSAYSPVDGTNTAG